MKTRVDLLVKNGLLLAHPGRPAQESATVAIKNGMILDLGPAESLAQQYEAPIEINASDCLIMPGLVNTHTHVAMSTLRGLADDLPLMDWLNLHIFPAESKLNADQVYWSTLLSCAEMIRSGTTTFCDMYLFEEYVARATDLAGLRALVGEGLFGFPSPNYGPIDAGIAYTKKLASDWSGHSRISIGVMPHAPYTCSPALMELAAKVARELKIPIATHLSETQAEVREIQMAHGCSPVALLDRHGILGPDLIAAHCVWLTPSDMDLLASRGVRVAHNPESNMKLASGVAPIPELLARGIPVGLGTDGSASNNDLDLFREMDSASKLQKVHRLDPTAMPAPQVLHMATLGGAKVLGMEESIGSLEPGKAADLIVVELQKPHLLPLYHLDSQLVYSTRGADVRDTIVHGKILMRDRTILSFDEAEVFAKIREIQQKILRDIKK